MSGMDVGDGSIDRSEAVSGNGRERFDGVVVAGSIPCCATWKDRDAVLSERSLPSPGESEIR